MIFFPSSTALCWSHVSIACTSGELQVWAALVVQQEICTLCDKKRAGGEGCSWVCRTKTRLWWAGHTEACKGFLDLIAKQEYSFLEHKLSPFYSLRDARMCLYGFCNSADVCQLCVPGCFAIFCCLCIIKTQVMSKRCRGQDINVLEKPRLVSSWCLVVRQVAVR